MANPNLAREICEAWEAALMETEDPYSGGSDLLHELFGRPRRSYRAHLDRTRINVYGRAIPRMVIVRRNIRQLNDPKLHAARLPL